MTAVNDTVTLEIPRHGDFVPILHMVLGGIGVRRNLSFDALDDLQLAVDSVLGGDRGNAADSLTMNVTVGQDVIEVELSGLVNEDLRATLRDGRVPPGAEARCIDVCVLLRSLVDSYGVRDLDDSAYAVSLSKSVR